MDAISNGLDAATTFDICRSMKLFISVMKSSLVVSLLQPAPEVFQLFDDLVLLSQGQIIYHGPVSEVLAYFERLGYQCPDHVDVADFLQEIPMPEGRKYLTFPGTDEKDPDAGPASSSSSSRAVGTAQLAAAWSASTLCKEMDTDMESSLAEPPLPWLSYHKEHYASSFMFYLSLLLDREKLIMSRDLSFIKSRLAQAVVVGSIVATLFTNLGPEDAQIMGGFLFFACLQGGLGGMNLLPAVFAQKAVYYKQYQASFFPALSFVLSQSFVLIPLQIVENLIFCLITYFAVGLSQDDGGGRFFIFFLTILMFSVCVTQIFRLVACLTPEATAAQPLCGVYLVVMVLFSGYIIPKNGISDGWIWFYWINPTAYALTGVTVNEFLGSEYDDLICLDYPACSQTIRFGDNILEGRGNPTEQSAVWYGILFLFGAYIVVLALTTLALAFVVTEPHPVPPEYEDDSVDGTPNAGGGAGVSAPATSGKEETIINAETYEEGQDDTGLQPAIIPFEPVSFSFKDVWYTVKLKDGEELDLLRGVSGCFDPGTVTALMGSSGAGKTTLLDVLAGRKNTGTITGLISVNGAPKEEHTFRKVMAYVEQFDSLNPSDTAREAIEFSAALRLPANTPEESRNAWVESIIDMLELTPIENSIVGSGASGFSFEQRKRLSIGVELASNPAILFLDEPTSGLDSRAAQVVVRSIKRVAASGRSVVCTIHQPSVFIFNSFESLLLLRRGGQTVFYGDLGEDSAKLIAYFEGAPGVPPCARQNPATWMLEQIGAGTGGSGSTLDFHEYYKKSVLCAENTLKVDTVCAPAPPMGTSQELVEGEGQGQEQMTEAQVDDSRPGYGTQFRLLLTRNFIAYWRNPDYNLVRMMISIIVAMLFASAFAQYKYTTYVDTISLAALMYITSLFIG